jgi:hypothetical protein
MAVSDEKIGKRYRWMTERISCRVMLCNHASVQHDSGLFMFSSHSRIPEHDAGREDIVVAATSHSQETSPKDAGCNPCRRP